MRKHQRWWIAVAGSTAMSLSGFGLLGGASALADERDELAWPVVEQRASTYALDGFEIADLPAGLDKYGINARSSTGQQGERHSHIAWVQGPDATYGKVAVIRADSLTTLDELRDRRYDHLDPASLEKVQVNGKDAYLSAETGDLFRLEEEGVAVTTYLQPQTWDTEELKAFAAAVQPQEAEQDTAAAQEQPAEKDTAEKDAEKPAEDQAAEEKAAEEKAAEEKAAADEAAEQEAGQDSAEQQQDAQPDAAEPAGEQAPEQDAAGQEEQQDAAEQEQAPAEDAGSEAPEGSEQEQQDADAAQQEQEGSEAAQQEQDAAEQQQDGAEQEAPAEEAPQQDGAAGDGAGQGGAAENEAAQDSAAAESELALPEGTTAEDVRVCLLESLHGRALEPQEREDARDAAAFSAVWSEADAVQRGNAVDACTQQLETERAQIDAVIALPETGTEPALTGRTDTAWDAAPWVLPSERVDG
ncbi:hypothetical protein [Nocardiopsis coralliicola]